MSKDKKESIQKYLKDKASEIGSPGMSAVFSALKDIDGIEKAKNKKNNSNKEKKESKTPSAKSAMKLESTQFLKLMNANVQN